MSALALVAIVFVGLRQAPETKTPSGGESHPLDAQTIRERLRGAPPALAALHSRANDLLPGGRRELARQLDSVRGHPVVVNVWAAWCGPCIVELPILQQVALDYGKRVAFLGVDVNDDRGRAQKLLRRIPVPYPSVEDPKGKIADDYRLVGTPSTVFYDARGRQTYVHQGPYTDRAAFEADIRRYATGA